ncbi:potassium transporter TrkG [Roseobacter sinensis]|uniref:potassium transporter TrkG n=1 Tax=Roseobacter sinensis TaxID=2931391 RepID=UPI0021E87B0A|nr:potassium transporter TrkG [Roseobacter sp. WL0113]
MFQDSDESDGAEQTETGKPRSLRARTIRLRAALLHTTPARLLLLGYLSYILLGWLLLSLPFPQDTAISAVDTLFIATSAASTTGLVSVDPGSSYTFFGELVILLLIQLGGLGYMTVGSFILMTAQDRMSKLRREATKNAFNLPENIRPKPVIRSVIRFTLICEAFGAAILFVFFRQQEVENPLWSAIFHSISAFCTAGFSLFSNSFQGFYAHPGITLTISALSILGAWAF